MTDGKTNYFTPCACTLGIMTMMIELTLFICGVCRYGTKQFTLQAFHNQRNPRKENESSYIATSLLELLSHSVCIIVVQPNFAPTIITPVIVIVMKLD